MLVVLLVLIGGGSATAQAPNLPKIFRHHVIFLLDASGSISAPPRSREEYADVIENKLPALLRDSVHNGFGVTLYDPAQDLTSAFAFGLSRETPLMAPSVADGFIRRLWFQEERKTCGDLVRVMPPLDLHWTAINSAFIQGVRKTRWEAEHWGVLDRGFDRTFLVMVSDGEANTSVNSLDEMREIHGAALSESKRSAGELRQDLREAEVYYDRLTNLFTLSASDSADSTQNSGSFLFGHFKILIRELRPQKLVNLGDLLEKGPDQEMQLERRAHDEFVGTLNLAPRPPRSEKEVSYQLVGLKYRLPGQTEYQTAAVASSAQPFEQAVKVSGNDIDNASADFQLSFVRRDPVYGQTVQVFEETIRFHRESRKYVLGVIPITDLTMLLHPGLSQDQIKYLDSVLLLVLFLTALGFLIFIVFFPRPTAEMELHGDAAVQASPLLVTFGRTSQQKGQQSILRSLRFKNIAFRTIPFLGGVLPRIAERHFDVLVKVKGEFHPDVKTRSAQAVGIDVKMHLECMLKRQTEGSQTTIVFSPETLADYLGKGRDPVKCGFTVMATQFGRRFGVLPFSRSLEPQSQSFYLRFDAEEPEMRVRLEPMLRANPTGTTEARAFPDYEGASEWRIWPHYKGRREEPNAVADFALQITNAATHICSKNASMNLTAVLYRADRPSKSYEIPVDIPHQNVFQVEAHQQSPLVIPLWLPYENLPPPHIEGDDYIVEATLTAADGQQWAPQTVRYGVRVGPDPRTTALSFKVGTADNNYGREFHWHTFGSPRDGVLLSVKAPVPVPWNIGKVKESSVFAKIAIDNVARLGDGVLRLKLLPGAGVSPSPTSDLPLEPQYVEREERRIVAFSDDGGRVFLNEPREWTLENEAMDRPIWLQLEFQPDAIKRIERNRPIYGYVCDLPFECIVRETSDSPELSFSFRLQVEFEVARYAGEYALAVDFGTSAVVVAFEGNERGITTRYHDVSGATLQLQDRYQELLKEWEGSNEDDLRDELQYERNRSNLERSTPFIPSALIMRQGKKIGEAEFVILPASFVDMSGGWNRTVYYLKGLILRGDEYLSTEAVTGLRALSWRDASEQMRNAENDKIPVDEIIRSAYRNLLSGYVQPLLESQAKGEYLSRLVISHPNSFTLSHIHRVRKILTETFPQFSINLLSESNAVAIYCARNPARHFQKIPEGGESRHLLVYDIGAGTVDLTYTRLEWVEVEGTSRLKEMKILFKAGMPVAGNQLDASLARILDRKIRSLIDPLREDGVKLEYVNPIVEPDNFDSIHYPLRMLEIKRALQRLKIELSASTDKDALFHVPISAAREILHQVAIISGPEEKLEKFQITMGRSGQESVIGIPLSRKEILEHPEVDHWLNQVTGELIENFSAALSVLGIKPKIDTLILSGRTAEFPPLRDRLRTSLSSELGLDESAYFLSELDRNEKKEAVALGSLLYAIFHGRDLRLVDRNIWTRYGVVYNDGRSQRFQEFFGYASNQQAGDKKDEDDHTTRVFYDRTLEVARADGQIEIASTLSRDPDADLADPEAYLERFQVIHTIGAHLLGPPGKVRIRMRNNEDDTLTVTIDPERLAKRVTVRGYRGDDHLGQMEWPYRPLERSKYSARGRANNS
jgi:hypothetical protein